MSEKLIIRNFGPVINVDLSFKRFNILIGEQATGKSTIVKLLAVCRYFSYIIPTDKQSTDWKGSNFLEGLDAWGLSEYIHNNTFIYYECEHYSIEVKIFLDRSLRKKDRVIGISLPNVLLKPLSVEFKALLKELKNVKSKLSKSSKRKYWSIPTSFFKNDVANIMDNPFYLPTERGLQSVFSLGKTSIQNISDSLYNQFARLDQIQRSFNKTTYIEPLNIQYKNVTGSGFVRKTGKKEFYSLFTGASGYQSAIPIVLAIKYYSEMRKKIKTFIIEEPEENLFPTTQNELVKFFAENLSKANGFLITTHSPYILTSLNNLMYAYSVGMSNGGSKKNTTSDVVQKQYWINPNDVSAYMLLPNGKYKDIFDREEKLIKAETIDSVSTVINNQFDDLLRIDLETKKKS